MEPSNNTGGRGRRTEWHEEHGMAGNRRTGRRDQRSRSRIRNDARGPGNRGASRTRRTGREDGLMMRHDRHRSRSGNRGDLPLPMRESMSILQNYLAECEHHLGECEMRRRQLARMVSHVLDYRQSQYSAQPGDNLDERSSRPIDLRLPRQLWGCAERHRAGDTGGDSSGIRSLDFLPLSLSRGGDRPQQTTGVAEGPNRNLANMALSTTPLEDGGIDMMAAGDGFHVVPDSTSSMTHSGENFFPPVSGLPDNNVTPQGSGSSEDVQE